MRYSAKQTMAWAFKEMRFELGRELSSFDMIEAAYWWFIEHHAGMRSDEYECYCVLSRVFTPRSAECGPELDSMAEMAYNVLCEQEVCQHATQGIA